MTVAAECINRTEHQINNNHKINVPSLRYALVNRNYAKLWYGQAVSAVGDTVFGTTLVLWVSQVLARGSAWAPAAVSGILVAAGAAVALVGPVAGVFVDRWNRKSTMLRTEAIRAAMVAGLTGLSFVPIPDFPAGLWLAAVYLVVFVLTAAGQFFNPARFATTGDVVPGEDDRIRATGLAEATTSAAGIIGPPIAALLLSPSNSSGPWPPTPPPMPCHTWPSACSGWRRVPGHGPVAERRGPACTPNSRPACGCSRATGSW